MIKDAIYDAQATVERTFQNQHKNPVFQSFVQMSRQLQLRPQN